MSAPARARTWSTNNANGHPGELRGRKSPPPSAYSCPPTSGAAAASATTTATRINTLEKTATQVTYITQQDGAAETEPVAAPSFLQPRIAAVLGVSRRWHPVLFSLRLLSIAPAIVLGFPLAIRFLLMLHEFAMSEQGVPAQGGRSAAEDRLLLTEMMLATLWCGCSGYLSFFFTDCLMSKWLINYTPSATAFRLVSFSALNGYLQSWTLDLSGSSQDPSLFLPAWITITSTLTMVYHVTYRKINIRKETSTSISVFSMASYLSMVALLIQQHWDRPWLELPFVALACRILKGGGEVVVTVAKYANITIEH